MSSICNQCNAPLEADDRFCPECGKKVEVVQSRNCSKCGNPLPEVGKFCISCGNPIPTGNTVVATPPAPKIEKPPVQPQETVVEPPVEKKPIRPAEKKVIAPVAPPRQTANKKAPAPNVGKSTATVVIVFLFMALLAVAAYFYTRKDKPAGEPRQEAVTRAEPAPDKPAVWKTWFAKLFGSSSKSKKGVLLLEKLINSRVSHYGLPAGELFSLNVPAALFDGEKKLVVTQIETGKYLPETFWQVIDIELENVRQLNGFLEINANAPVGFNPENQIVECLTFSETTKTWEPVAAWYDPSTGQIRSFTNHLSVFGYRINDITEEPYQPEKLIDEASLRRDFQLNRMHPASLMLLFTNSRGRYNNEALMVSWDMTGKAMRINEVSSRPESYGNLGALNNQAALYPLGLAAISMGQPQQRIPREELQRVKDSYRDVPDELRSQQPIKDAFTALFALESLDVEGASVTIGSGVPSMATFFDAFFQKPGKPGVREISWWKTQLLQSVKQVENPVIFDQIVNRLIDGQFDEFWFDNANQKAVVEEIKRQGFETSIPPSEMVKSDIANQFRLFSLSYIQPAIEALQMDYAVMARIGLQENLRQLAHNLNTRHHIRCKMKLNAVQKTINYAGSRIQFHVQPEYQQAWQGVMGADETLDFYFTKAGYIEAGMPTRATLYLNQKNEKDQITVEFVLNEGTTELVFEPDDFAPLWGGKKVDINAELQKQKRDLEQIYKQLNR